jgi:hypothetical protein
MYYDNDMIDISKKGEHENICCALALFTEMILGILLHFIGNVLCNYTSDDYIFARRTF